MSTDTVKHTFYEIQGRKYQDINNKRYDLEELSSEVNSKLCILGSLVNKEKAPTFAVWEHGDLIMFQHYIKEELANL